MTDAPALSVSIAAPCRCCGAPLSGDDLAIGPIPVCNRFSAAAQSGPTVRLQITRCSRCGLVQLRQAPAPDLLTPRVPWIRYREPEGHLDELAASLGHLLAGSSSGQGRRAIGLGPFEAPLLARLAETGIATVSPDLVASSRRDPDRFPYLETWAASLDSSRLEPHAREGPFDIVSCRYLLEHCDKPVAALTALGSLLARDGLLVLEVPDSAKFLAARDYCFPWEEHTSYFVEQSFVQTAARAGFVLESMLRAPGPLEDALVGIFRLGSASLPNATADDDFADYRSGFAETRVFLQARLAELAGPARDRVAIFGIGHHAIMFANALGVGHSIGAAVDDDPDKGGLFPPGFAVPVQGSEALLGNTRITTCLLALSPAVEPRIRAKIGDLERRGVAFRSIYAGVRGSIYEGRPS